jgi:YHS domain-containing protein
MRHAEPVFPHPRRENTSMNLIRQSTWTILILGAAAGCTDDGAAPPDAPSSAAVTVKPDSTAIPPAPPLPAAKKTDEPPQVEGPKTESGKSGAAAAKLTADEVAAIKELPAAEQPLATKQVVCPVSAHNLGSMGKPIKVTAEGRTFYICCEGCEEKVKSDPKAVVAKLDPK